MKQTILAVTVSILFLGCACPVNGQEVTALSLEEAVRITLEKSPKVQQAKARLERTEGQIKRTLAPFQKPTITLTGNYSRLSTSNAQSGAGGGGGGAVQNPFSVGLSGTVPGTQAVQLSSTSGGSGSGSSGGGTSSGTGTTTTRSRQTDPGTDPPADTPNLSDFGFTTALDQITGGVSIAQRIDITGLNRAYQRVTNTERALVQQEFEQTKQEAVYNVTTAYYSALRAKELIRVSEAAVQQSEEQVRIAQVQFTQGNYAKNDVLRAKSQLANNQQSLISAQNQAAIARNSLANTIGLDPATPMALAGEDTATLPNLPQLDKEMLLTEAFSHRPEAVRAQLNQEKAKTNTRIARQGQEPYLTASLNGNYNATDGIPSSRRATGSVGLTLSFPLSDGGVTAGNIRTARADEQIAEAQIVEYRNGITAEVEQAIIAVRDAYERAQSALPALEEAREGYRLSEARLKAGAGTQLALYDSQAALVQAEVNAINARYDYFSSLARLARAIGTSVENP